MRRHIVVYVVMAALAGLAAQASATLLRGSVVSSGGTPSAGSTNAAHKLFGSVTPAVGLGANVVHILCSGFWCFGGPRVVSVDDPPGPHGLPTEMSFGMPTPNPTSRGARFALALPKAAQVSLAIYDLQGRVVQQASGTMEAGY